MADLFKKKTPAEEAPVVADANADAPAPEVKGKKDKKSKVKYLEPNQMNFLEQYSIVVEGKKKNLDLQKVMKPLIAVLIVVLAAFVILEVVLLGMKAQTKSLNKYITDEQNVASYNEAIEVKTNTDIVNAKKASTESVINAIDSYPNVGTDFFATLKSTAAANSVTIASYGYSNDNGYLTLSCSATGVDNVSEFVRALEKCGLLNITQYSGFSGSAEGGYSFSVTGYCVGDANVEVPVVEAPAEEAPAEEVTEG